MVAAVAPVQWLINTIPKTIPKVSGSFYFYIIKYSMKKKLLFVCVENSNRSQMSQAFAKMLGGENVEAYSAGSKPSGIVNPKAIAAMKELGYDLGKHDSKSLKDVEQFAPFDAVVTMGCGDACPLDACKKIY
jgi:protein-tyrosine-phosphatase